MSRLEIIFACVIAALLALGAVALVERHRGAQACVVADQHVAAARIVRNAQTQAAATVEVAKEKTDYEAALIQPVLHPVLVRMCVAPIPSGGAVLPAGASPAGIAYESASRAGADHGLALPQSTLGPELQAIGRDADAQIAGLQSYILNVCRKE